MRRPAWFLAVALFAYATAVQWNDPDALRWMFLYGGAALLCAEAAFRWPPAWVPGTIGAVALVWAATLLPHVVSDMALTFDEEERELGGLVIVAAVMAAVALGSWRARNRRGAR